MTIHRILIVENDLEMQEMMATFLQKNGFMASVAKNSNELKQTLTLHRIDLILLDVMLEDESGITLCKQIRI